MIFKPELAAAVMAGTKTVTRRLVSDKPLSPWWRGRCGYRVGQEVAICPGRSKHQIGKAVVVSVEKVTLGVVGDDEAKREGFPSASHFIDAWAAINGTYDPWAVVWRIGLEAVRP
jgi:hypothetical protein